jgi:hypothetical protein
MGRSGIAAVFTAMHSMALVAGCTPTVKVEAPDKPITINLNVKIEHDIRVKLDRELDTLFNEKSDFY